MSERTTSFGFTEIPEDEKQARVAGVFSSVARSYDRMNDLMSAGVHRLWKDDFVTRLAPQPGMAVIDVAGGTGDIAFRIRDRVAPKGTAAVTICDINADMLAAGRTRPDAARHAAGLSWVCGDAERLPFPGRSFDAYTIAFGIRNVTHIRAALAEARRVLRTGGRFLCLEFARVDVPFLDALYDQWSFKAIPAIGAAVANDRASYQYLVESIRRFPPQDAFARMIAEAGFERVRYTNLSGGIAAIHSGWVL